MTEENEEETFFDDVQRVQFEERSSNLWLIMQRVKEGWSLFWTDYDDEMLAFLEGEEDILLVITGDLPCRKAVVAIKHGSAAAKFSLRWG